MKLTAPTQSIDFTIQDINGNNLSLSDFKGQRVLLSFFRNAECPFCNFRIHEMTQRYREWRERGLEVIAVFVSSPEDVKRFVARRPRPFHIIGDPDLALYRQYGVEKSTIGLIKAMMLRIPTLVRGILRGGNPMGKNPHMTLVPADFLLDEQGRVVDSFYGRDISEHIPLDRIEGFLNPPAKAQAVA